MILHGNRFLTNMSSYDQQQTLARNAILIVRFAHNVREVIATRRAGVTPPVAKEFATAFYGKASEQRLLFHAWKNVSNEIRTLDL